MQERASCPPWSGFNQSVVHQGRYDISHIEIIPFLNQDKNQPATIYSALVFIQQLTEKYQVVVSPVTFGQPLYIKAAEIAETSHYLSNITVRLGGFHLVISYMGVIGHITRGRGITRNLPWGGHLVDRH